MEFFRLAIFVPLALVSCASHEVAETVELHSVKAGEEFASEVFAQSPFETVKMTWDDAKVTMYNRNTKYIKAYEDRGEAAAQSPVVRDMMSHMRTSLTDTAKGALDPGELLKVVKSPLEELPKHLENIASIKDFSHEMQLEAYQNVKQVAVSQQQLRKQEADLYALFLKDNIFEQQKACLDEWSSLRGDAQVAAKVKVLLKKDVLAYQAAREKWLDQIRDFFNAEYADVDFMGGQHEFPRYRGVKNPKFQDWQRWRVLERSEQMATVLRKDHKESKPVVPGANLVKNKLMVMVNMDTSEEPEVDQDRLRSDVRGVLRSWRLLKKAQKDLKDVDAKIAKLNKLRDSQKDAGEEQKKVFSEAQQMELYMLQKKRVSLMFAEVDQAKRIWVIDEHCWSAIES